MFAIHIIIGRLEIQAEEVRKKGTTMAGKLDHLYFLVKAEECQPLSITILFSSRWKFEGRISDWLSLAGRDQGILIDSPIILLNVKVVLPNKTGCHCPEKGDMFQAGRPRSTQIHYNWEGSGHHATQRMNEGVRALLLGNKKTWYSGLALNS